MRKSIDTRAIVEEILEDFENRFKVSHIERISKREAKLSPFPKKINPKLTNVLIKSGIKSLYSHQAQAIKEILNKRNTIVVTPTASGKTLCYNIPVLNSIIKDPDTKALYLFPTKALSQDQIKALERLIIPLGIDIKTYTYDGDTPTSVRKRLRTYGNIIITNPDMLHTGILPHHTRWLGFFTKLKYVVIDEIHTYRGLFGSHMANLINRLDRICKFYNSDPIYICSSATIANPKELVEKLTNKEFVLIDDNGAPSGEKWFIFWNPPRIAETIERRRSSLVEAKEIGKKLIESGVQTIFFTRTRVSAEVLGTYLKQSIDPGLVKRIKSYRAGYLPIERREIEKKLFSGDIIGVVSTTALELGIDIGELDSSILVGYPGSISSTWQQAGRAGRGEDFALAILIASDNPIEQFLMHNPGYFFGNPVESAIIDPENIYILVNHIKCADFEIPFKDGERFGNIEILPYLKYLEDKKIIRHVGEKWHWTSESYPAEDISLRSTSSDSFVIQNRTNNHEVIGYVDADTAFELIHPGAIYLHQTQQYEVEDLNIDNKIATVAPVNVDYYTYAVTKIKLNVLSIDEKDYLNKYQKEYGDVKVTSTVTAYNKFKFYTSEIVGGNKLKLPSQIIHTNSTQIGIKPSLLERAVFSGGKSKDVLKASAILLENVVPLYILCDRKDVRTHWELKDEINELPTIYFYDYVPGGMGLSEKLYEILPEIFNAALKLIKGCDCVNGCPSCIGPIYGKMGNLIKQGTKFILSEMVKLNA